MLLKTFYRTLLLSTLILLQPFFSKFQLILAFFCSFQVISNVLFYFFWLFLPISLFVLHSAFLGLISVFFFFLFSQLQLISTKCQTSGYFSALCSLKHLSAYLFFVLISADFLSSAILLLSSHFNFFLSIYFFNPFRILFSGF